MFSAGRCVQVVDLFGIVLQCPRTSLIFSLSSYVHFVDDTDAVGARGSFPVGSGLFSYPNKTGSVDSVWLGGKRIDAVFAGFASRAPSLA